MVGEQLLRVSSSSKSFQLLGRRRLTTQPTDQITLLPHSLASFSMALQPNTVRPEPNVAVRSLQMVTPVWAWFMRRSLNLTASSYTSASSASSVGRYRRNIAMVGSLARLPPMPFG